MQKVGEWEEKEEVFWVSSVSVTKSFWSSLLCEVSLEVFGKSNTALNDLILSPSHYALVGKVFGQVSFFTMGTRWGNFISEYWAPVSCLFVELFEEARHVLSWEPESLLSGDYITCLIQPLLVHTASDSSLHVTYIHAMARPGLKVSEIMICCKFNLFNIGIMYSVMSLPPAWRMKITRWLKHSAFSFSTFTSIISMVQMDTWSPVIGTGQEVHLQFLSLVPVCPAQRYLIHSILYLSVEYMNKQISQALLVKVLLNALSSSIKYLLACNLMS